MDHRLVPKLNDRDLIRAFEKIKEKYIEGDSSIAFLDQFSDEISDENLSEISKLSGFVIRTAILKIDNITWKLSRLEDSGPVRFDSIALYFNGQSQNHGHRPNDRQKFFFADAMLIEALSHPLASGKSAAKYADVNSHGAILEKMESVAAHLIEDTDQHRKSLDSDYIENERRRQEYFDASIADARKTIEEDRHRLESDYSKRNSFLDEKESELNELKKQLDDRNNTHVRREIRSSLLKLAEDRLQNFTISETTKKQHLAVNAASVFGFITLAAASVYFGSAVSIDPGTKKYPAEAIALIIKSASYAAAAIALGSWYLGWLNRWLQRVADSEFKLQQFRLDIERASWLAETVLEWKSSSQEPFPELLTARLSTGLFQATGTDADGPRTPASHLAEALLGSASSAKLRLGENELNFDRKGINRLDE